MSDAWWLLAPLVLMFMGAMWAVIVDLRKAHEASLDATALRQASFLDEDTEWGGKDEIRYP